MKYTFASLFEVTFPHAYYDEGVVQDVLMQPASSSQNLMEGLGLLFREKPGGFVVLAQANSDGKTDSQQPVKALKSSDRLAFYLTPQADRFYKVTNLPPLRGSILYANNLTSSRGRPERQSWEELPAKPNLWRFDLAEAIGQAGFGLSNLQMKLQEGGAVIVQSYTVKDFNGETVIQSDEIQVTRYVDVDCSGLLEGGYTLEVELEKRQKLPEYRFVYSALKNPALALYQWFPRLKLGRLNSNIDLSLEYQQAFQNIESHWRYYIISSKNIQASSIDLSAKLVNGVVVDFGVGSEVLTPAGRSAIAFTSKQCIPLKQSSSGVVSIKRAGDDISIAVPFANEGSKNESGRGEPEWISSIYVYQ